MSHVTIINGRRGLVLSAEPGVFEELFLQERKLRGQMKERRPVNASTLSRDH